MATPYVCCSKIVCTACNFANTRLNSLSCPFCRKKIKSQADFEEGKKKTLGANHPLVLLEKRAEANDPIALIQLALLEIKKKTIKRH